MSTNGDSTDHFTQEQKKNHRAIDEVRESITHIGQRCSARQMFEQPTPHQRKREGERVMIGSQQDFSLLCSDENRLIEINTLTCAGTRHSWCRCCCCCCYRRVTTTPYGVVLAVSNNLEQAAQPVTRTQTKWFCCCMILVFFRFCFRSTLFMSKILSFLSRFCSPSSRGRKN